MLPTLSPFRVDILAADGDVLGGGPLTTVLNLNDTRSLDKVGSLTFTLPAGDPRSALIGPGTMFDVWDAVDGYIGRFLFASLMLSDTPSGSPMLNIDCDDVLLELGRSATVGFRRAYANVAVGTVVADLVSIVPGWTSDIESGIGNTSVTYEGESPLRAIDILRDRFGKHYRLSPNVAKELQFGAFGDPSGVRLIQGQGQVQADFADKTEIAFIDTFKLNYADDDVVNIVIPLGAGQGVSQLTIETATLGSYTTETGLNDDGSEYYYIKDDASIAAYGPRVRVAGFSNMRPITNSVTNITNAANALKLTAEVYLTRNKDPRREYTISVRALRRPINVGDTVRVVYKGRIDGYTYVDIDEDFYVMDVSRRRTSDGERSAQLVISSVDERRTSDTDIVLDMMYDVKALKVHIPITLAYSSVGPYTRRIGGGVEAEFTVRIGAEVTNMNYAILRFRTSGLKSSVVGGGAGGGTVATTSSVGHTHAIAGSTVATPDVPDDFENRLLRVLTDADEIHYIEVPTTLPETFTLVAQSSGSHAHSVTLLDHTHPLVYGIYEDNVNPDTIRVEINGDDRTALLGGPWATDGSEVEEEIEITDLLLNDSGGLRQLHRIVFSCDDAHGEIEVEVDMLLSIQPIAVS